MTLEQLFKANELQKKIERFGRDYEAFLQGALRLRQDYIISAAEYDTITATVYAGRVDTLTRLKAEFDTL